VVVPWAVGELGRGEALLAGKLGEDRLGDGELHVRAEEAVTVEFAGNLVGAFAPFFRIEGHDSAVVES
jgi:hypothetical protein